MKKRFLSRVSWVLTSIFAALMLFTAILLAVLVLSLSCDGGTVVMGPGPGFPGTPTAVASADPLTGDSPVTVTLSAAGSYDSDGKIVRWQWDFENDGAYDWSSATSGTVSHEYPAGEYTAKLLVTDDSGKSATATVTNIFSNPAHLYWTFDEIGEGLNPTLTLNPVNGNRIIAFCNALTAKLAISSDTGRWSNEDLPWNVSSIGTEAHEIAGISNVVCAMNGTIYLAVSTVDGYFVGFSRNTLGQWREEFIFTSTNSSIEQPVAAISSDGSPAFAFRDSGNYVFVGVSGSEWVSINTGFDLEQYHGFRPGLDFDGSNPMMLISRVSTFVIRASGAFKWTKEEVRAGDAPVGVAKFIKAGESADVLLELGGSLLKYIESDGIWTSTVVANWRALFSATMPPVHDSLLEDGKTYVFSGYSLTYYDGSFGIRERLPTSRGGIVADHSLIVDSTGRCMIVYVDQNTGLVMFGIRLSF